jgi:hypothetical protein
VQLFYILMDTSNNTNCSVVDLQNMRLDTYVGRAQIRDELENGFHVPPEVIGWFFEVIDDQQLAIRELEKTLRDEIFQ